MKSIPDACDGGFGAFCFLGHGPVAPMCAVLRCCLKSLLDKVGHTLFIVSAGATGAYLVIQARNAIFDEASFPCTDSNPGYLELGRDLQVIHSLALDNTICALLARPWGRARDEAMVSNCCFSSTPKETFCGALPFLMDILL